MLIDILTPEPVNRSVPHISLHHVTRFEPITAAHFGQSYNNNAYRIYGLYTKLYAHKIAVFNFLSINSTVSRAMSIVVNEAWLS